MLQRVAACASRRPHAAERGRGRADRSPGLADRGRSSAASGSAPATKGARPPVPPGSLRTRAIAREVHTVVRAGPAGGMQSSFSGRQHARSMPGAQPPRSLDRCGQTRHSSPRSEAGAEGSCGPWSVDFTSDSARRPWIPTAPAAARPAYSADTRPRRFPGQAAGIPAASAAAGDSRLSVARIASTAAGELR